MNTYTPKKSDLQDKKWYLVDAADKIPGRFATTIANKLRGKDKPIFTPNIDCGDFVIVINADKIKMTGGKMEKKLYQKHSGFPGGLKEETAENLMARKPGKVIEEAVLGMLPKNKLRKTFMSKLKVYGGDNHPHQAQNPINLEV